MKMVWFSTGMLVYQKVNSGFMNANDAINKKTAVTSFWMSFLDFCWRVCCGRWVSGVPSIPGAAFESYAYDRPRSPIRVPATSPPRLVSPRRSESPRSSRCLVKFMVSRLDAMVMLKYVEICWDMLKLKRSFALFCEFWFVRSFYHEFSVVFLAACSACASRAQKTREDDSSQWSQEKRIEKCFPATWALVIGSEHLEWRFPVVWICLDERIWWNKVFIM